MGLPIAHCSQTSIIYLFSTQCQIMISIENENSLMEWLDGKPLEFTMTLVARIVLRVTPLLVKTLCEDDPSDRNLFALTFFRALSVVSFLGARPLHMKDLQNSVHHAHAAIRKAYDAIDDRYDDIQRAKVEVTDLAGIVDFDYYKSIKDLEIKAGAFSIAGEAINTAVYAVQVTVDAVDVANGIAGPDAVHEAVASAVTASIKAVDGVNSKTLVNDSLMEFEQEEEAVEEEPVADHITDLWKAVSLDAGILSSDNKEEKHGPENVVAVLSEMALWLDGIPIWTSRHWADFKNALPDSETWHVWTDWYEARLTGQPLDELLEFKRINIANGDWEQGSSHVNAMIKNLIEARGDPVITAISHSIEELDAVEDVIDLREYMDRIRLALPDDPVERPSEFWQGYGFY